MRKFKLSTLLVLLLSIVVAVSCNENPPIEEQPKTAVELAQTYLDVAADGGDYAVNYTITNPIAGIDIVATANVDWGVPGSSPG